MDRISVRIVFSGIISVLATLMIWWNSEMAGITLVFAAGMMLLACFVFFQLLVYQNDKQAVWRWVGTPQGFCYIIFAVGFAASFASCFTDHMNIFAFVVCLVAALFMLCLGGVFLAIALMSVPGRSLDERTFLLVGSPIAGLLVAQYLLVTSRTLLEALATVLIFSGLSLLIHNGKNGKKCSLVEKR